MKEVYGYWFCCLDCGRIFIGYSNNRYCKKCKLEIEEIFPPKPYWWDKGFLNTK